MFSIPLTTKCWNIGYLKNISTSPRGQWVMKRVLETRFFFTAVTWFRIKAGTRWKYCSPLQFVNACIPVRSSPLFSFYIIVIIYLQNALSICVGHFLQIRHKRHPIACPSVQGKWILWVQVLLVSLPLLFLLCFVFALANLFEMHAGKCLLRKSRNYFYGIWQYKVLNIRKLFQSKESYEREIDRQNFNRLQTILHA